MHVCIYLCTWVCVARSTHHNVRRLTQSMKCFLLFFAVSREMHSRLLGLLHGTHTHTERHAALEHHAPLTTVCINTRKQALLAEVCRCVYISVERKESITTRHCPPHLRLFSMPLPIPPTNSGHLRVLPRRAIVHTTDIKKRVASAKQMSTERGSRASFPPRWAAVHPCSPQPPHRTGNPRPPASQGTRH